MGEGENSFSEWFASLSIEKRAKLAEKWMPEDGKDPDALWFLKQQVRMAHDVMSGELHPGIFDLMAPVNRNILEALKLLAPRRGGPMVEVNNIQLPPKPEPLQLPEEWVVEPPRVAIEDTLRARRASA